MADAATDRRREVRHADMVNPTKDEIVAARKAAGLTQEQAASLVYRRRLAWNRWESGDPIDMACWELFLHKTRAARKKNSIT